MIDHPGFMEAIRADPEDDAPRLIYADWLEEQDTPTARVRAAFIRKMIASGARQTADGSGEWLTPFVYRRAKAAWGWGGGAGKGYKGIVADLNKFFPRLPPDKIARISFYHGVAEGAAMGLEAWGEVGPNLSQAMLFGGLNLIDLRPHIIRQADHTLAVFTNIPPRANSREATWEVPAAIFDLVGEADERDVRYRTGSALFSSAGGRKLPREIIFTTSEFAGVENGPERASREYLWSKSVSEFVEFAAVLWARRLAAELWRGVPQ